MTIQTRGEAQLAKIGRPTSYLPEYDALVVQLGEQGYSKAEMCKELGSISAETLTDWGKANPSFSEALARARSMSLAWWEAQGRTNLGVRDFNSNLYRVATQGRFPAEYRDSQRLEVTQVPSTVDLGALTPEERDALRSLLAKASKPSTAATPQPAPQHVQAIEAKPLAQLTKLN